MIAGGTGVTPMFHVIEQHLKFGNDKNKMLLIWYNRTCQDTFATNLLKYYQQKFPRRLFIIFIFSTKTKTQQHNFCWRQP